MTTSADVKEGDQRIPTSISIESGYVTHATIGRMRRASVPRLCRCEGKHERERIQLSAAAPTRMEPTTSVDDAA
jgi:hypothetical protein